MKASELIAELQRLMQESGDDPEVLAQSSGCCYHGHEIEKIERGQSSYRGVYTGEEGAIILRV